MAGARGRDARRRACRASRRTAGWFGEDQARYVIACRKTRADGVLKDLAARGVPARRIGVTGGDALNLPGEASILVRELSDAHEGWLPVFMAAPAKG